ncbi:hypothetical protein [Salipiger mucosus]|uniref:Uncharacterized protein n=1 Tax=Salipiger mucosus DSM 16094 TaxID=1123237 RepID=S9R4W7_9RHOB|nr:hypothetical protein [Salipiger mucosus]EPX86967.1 hypothetical protein Salmuc_02942 [Salipiger mucosus DSM 16094]
MTDDAGPKASIPSRYEPILDNDPRLSEITRAGLRQLAPAGAPEGFAGIEEGMPGALGDPEAALVLNQHMVSTVAYTRDQSGKTSFFSSLFKADAKAQQVGVIQEAKTFAVVEHDGEEIEMGVAARVHVVASSFSADVQVTIPNIAAEAQLRASRAEMEISVRGFGAPLGELLPVPRAVDVTSYAEYLGAFAKIQRHIFSEAGRQNYAPVALGVHKRNVAGGA